MADGRAIRVVRQDPGVSVDTSRWPATVPAVEQLLCEGLELPTGLTVLVGENGTGKSTVMEILAEACRLNPQGGSAQARLFGTRDSEPGLSAQLIVERGPSGRTGPISCAPTPCTASTPTWRSIPANARSGSMS
jgi:predicted ATPase